MSEKVALYARVSTKNQDLDSQVEKLKNYAERKEFNYDLYKEQVSSIKERPKFEKIMENLGQYGKVIVTKIDRFARSIRDFTERINDLELEDVDFEAVDQPINTDDEVYGDFLMKMLALFAELERKMIRRRMEEGFERAKEENRVGRPAKLTKKDKDKIELLYKEKSYSWQSLAKEFDCSRSTIHRTLKERGVIDN